jgi:RNA-directed DNA polymerase
VRQVTPDARGQKPPGVAGLAARTPAARRTLAEPLQRDGNAAPGRRVFRPPPGTRELRPLGRPTRAERAPPGGVPPGREPAGDARCAPQRDGVRPGWRPWEAIDALAVPRHQHPPGVLVADLAPGGDGLDHDAGVRTRAADA